MKKSALSFVLGLSLVFVPTLFEMAKDTESNGNIVETAINLSTWMTDNYEKIKDKELRNLVIPGTHDSGTALISEENAVVSSDKGIPETLAKIAPRKLVGWSKTQDLTIRKQLGIGVRFFDFRVSFEKEGKNSDYTLYLSHGLRGEKLDDVLADIRDFAENNPREIVMIKFKSFADEKCKKENLNKLLADKFKQYLENFIIQRQDIDVNLPLATVKKLVDTKKSIIVLIEIKRSLKSNFKQAEDTLNSEGFLFDSEKFLGSPWGNKQSVPDLVKYTLSQARDYAKNGKYNDKLYSLHWTLTADVKYIVSHLTNNEGIRYLTAKLNGQKKYKKDYSLSTVLKNVDRVNIVQQDFITREKTESLIRMNW